MAENPEKLPASSNAALPPTHTVLILEDTIELAEILQATLERMNLKVYHESYGESAIERYMEVKPDVMLLDLALPDTTGWKVLEAIREQQRGGKGARIIVITAYGDPANRLMGKLQDIYDYLVKPLKPDDIEAIVRKALNLPRKK